jgi:hypothetical protein
MSPGYLLGSFGKATCILMGPYLDKKVPKLLTHGQFCGCQVTTNFLKR